MYGVHHHHVHRTPSECDNQDVQCSDMAYPAKTGRDCILAAAMEQIESSGGEPLAIRSVAAKLGLAPNALYRYFENLAALEQAVAEEVRLQMFQRMQDAADQHDSHGEHSAPDQLKAPDQHSAAGQFSATGQADAAEQTDPSATMRAIAEAYLRYAQQQPHLFTYTMKPTCTGLPSPQCVQSTAFLQQQVARLYGDDRATAATNALLSFLRGLALSSNAGVLPPEQASTCFHFGLEAWIEDALRQPDKAP